MTAGIAAIWTAALSGASFTGLRIPAGIPAALTLTLTGLCIVSICQFAWQHTPPVANPITGHLTGRLRLETMISIAVLATGLAMSLAAALSGAEGQSIPALSSAVLSFTGCLVYAHVCWPAPTQPQ